jgi:hypothetical protein
LESAGVAVRGASDLRSKINNRRIPLSERDPHCFVHRKIIVTRYE